MSPSGPCIEAPSVSQAACAVRPSKGERGFGFVEVMISLVLVMVAAAAGAAMLISTVHATQFAAGAQTATRLGQEVIDRVGAENYAVVGGTGSICTSSLGSTYAAHSTGSAGSMTTSYTRICTVQTLTADVKLVTVVVKWANYQDPTRTHSVTLGVLRAP
jgi:Tfp pilus assembly protein PilV